MFGLFKERFDIICYEGLSHEFNWPYVPYCMFLFLKIEEKKSNLDWVALSDSFFPFNHLSCIDIFQMLCICKRTIIVNYLKVTTTYFFTHFNWCAALFTFKCLNNFKFNYCVQCAALFFLASSSLNCLNCNNALLLK